MNPRFLLLQDRINTELTDIDSAILVYEKGFAKISLHTNKSASNSQDNSTSVKEIGLDDLRGILACFMNLHIAINYDSLEVFNKLNHRRITYLRLFLPEGTYQINYDDEYITGSCDERLSEEVRKLWSKA